MFYVWRRVVCTANWSTEPKIAPREWIPVRIGFDVLLVVHFQWIEEHIRTHMLTYGNNMNRFIKTRTENRVCTCMCVGEFLVFNLYTWIWIISYICSYRRKMVDQNMFGVCLFNFKSAILIILFVCWRIHGSIDGE